MADILIGFASMSGNTEDIADLLHTHLQDAHEVVMEEIEDIEVSNLKEFDCILIGSYTWNDGDLPYEVEDFYDELSEVDLSGVPAAVFGSGDPTYPKFCEAVHLIQHQLQISGANLIQEELEIEMNPDEESDLLRCKQFAEGISNYLSEVKI
ncbi:flavodoxin [Halobacillus litoralis]|uniref:Flavodoxin n=1 Tax=Halobacillus litoralis TaxID=45668 RepID=A0A410MGC9_9BACI|nr:flavodoxin [Halobacillus litoralis]QAS53794.1 flavodoxin [Halobacillus litoralis]